MKTSRFTDGQIIAVLKQAEAGSTASATPRFMNEWRAKYGGMDASLMARMKELEDEIEMAQWAVAQAQPR